MIVGISLAVATECCLVMAEPLNEFAGHGGEYSGYYCKFASIIDNRLLSAPSRSRYVEEVSMVVDEAECQGDPSDYSSFEPERPPNHQQWLLVWIPEENSYRIINRNSGMLLCVQSRTDRENHRIVQYHDQALNFQWWGLQAVRKECFKVVNRKSRKVLTAKSGCVVQQTSDKNSQIQLWHIYPLDHSGYVGEYQIRNVNASKLLCIKSQNITDNARAVIFEDQSDQIDEKEFTNYQSWRLFIHGWNKGGFMIQNTHSGKILCMSGRSTNPGAKAVQFKNLELPYQKWSFEAASSNEVKIVNVNSGLLLSVLDHATRNDSFVVQLGDQNQCWEFIHQSGDSDVHLNRLIKFYYSPPEFDNDYDDDDVEESESSMDPELRQWYENFIQAFSLEVLVLLGVFPPPVPEDLAAISHLILRDSSVVTDLESFLESTVTVDTFFLILDLLRNRDLWNPFFKLLLKPVWSLPTLVKATTTIRSWICGAGTARTVHLLEKSVTVLGLIYKMKPTPPEVNRCTQS